jgi:ABC-type long-subunit fatty acid transport system fused permease/ATPase subunit
VGWFICIFCAKIFLFFPERFLHRNANIIEIDRMLKRLGYGFISSLIVLLLFIFISGVLSAAGKNDKDILSIAQQEGSLIEAIVVIGLFGFIVGAGTAPIDK